MTSLQYISPDTDWVEVGSRIDGGPFGYERNFPQNRWCQIIQADGVIMWRVNMDVVTLRSDGTLALQDVDNIAHGTADSFDEAKVLAHAAAAEFVIHEVPF